MTFPAEFYGTVAGLWQVYQPVVILWLAVLVGAAGAMGAFLLLYPIVARFFGRYS
jgi:hypothetical protein